MKHYSKGKRLYFFFGFWFNFWYPGKSNCLLFVIVIIIIIVVDTTVFFSKLFIICCNTFDRIAFLVLRYLFSVRYPISTLKYFSEQILVALARNLFNMLVIVP